MTQPMYSNLGFEQAIELSKGATFAIEINVYADDTGTPYDLTGCEVRAAIQGKSDSAERVNFPTFTIDDDPTTGRARSKMAAAATATLTANDKRLSPAAYRWACEIKTPSGDILPFCHGDVFVRSNGVDWN